MTDQVNNCSIPTALIQLRDGGICDLTNELGVTNLAQIHAECRTYLDLFQLITFEVTHSVFEY